MDEVEFNKRNFLEAYLQKHRELGKRQREYKKILSCKLLTRRETIIESSYENAIEQLTEEKNDLRAQIWVASGNTHKFTNRRCLREIHCHVQCQEHLAEDIRKLKVSIANMEREISRVNKQIYDLNRLTVPDSQHQMHVARACKKLMILENALEAGVRQECEFTAINGTLREQLIRILNHRTFFNDAYTKMVQKLNSDQKYMLDLIEYALNTFDGCIEIYEKMDNIIKRESKEQELRKIEMQGIMRKVAADTDNKGFLEAKAKVRELADLQPKEYKRREEFRRKHEKKINLYNSVLRKLLSYTDSQSVNIVIEKFQQQESLYYSFFNYANEMSYHITLLNNSVNILFGDILELKNDNTRKLESQLEEINQLEDSVLQLRRSNDMLQQKRDENDKRFENLMQGVETLCEMCNADTTPLLSLLGNHAHVSLVNFQHFLKILELRIHEITACVYAQERSNTEPMEFIVNDVSKHCEAITSLHDIVLTQQCPECAEAEAFNMDEGGESVGINTVEEAKHKLYEKIVQPEMQYRLHSISQCRLPRSRLLAAKRHI